MTQKDATAAKVPQVPGRWTEDDQPTRDWLIATTGNLLDRMLSSADPDHGAAVKYCELLSKLLPSAGKGSIGKARMDELRQKAS